MPGVPRLRILRMGSGWGMSWGKQSRHIRQWYRYCRSPAPPRPDTSPPPSTARPTRLLWSRRRLLLSSRRGAARPRVHPSSASATTAAADIDDLGSPSLPLCRPTSSGSWRGACSEGSPPSLCRSYSMAVPTPHPPEPPRW